MATNDFLPFAVGGGANVLSQAAYAALTTLLSGGYQSGVANSAQMNKTWRQSSIMAAVVGQFAADYSGNNSTDDGTTATLEANLVAAIRSATKTGVILADTGAANAYTAVNAPPLVSGTWVDGVVQQIRIAHANTGASTYAPDGLTAIPIYGLGLQPLQGGELALNGIAILVRMTIAGVNSGNPIAVLMECAGGAQQVAPATQSQHAVQLGQVQQNYAWNHGLQEVSATGNFGVPANVYFVKYRMWAGGGGSGGTGAAGQTAGGGGGGEYAEGILAVTPSTNISCTIGAAGTAGGAGGTGGIGGTTSFTYNSTTITCVGGSGGSNGNASGGNGGGGGTGGTGTAGRRIAGAGGAGGSGSAGAGGVGGAAGGGGGGGGGGAPGPANGGATPGGGAGAPGASGATGGSAGGAGRIVFEW